MKYFLMLLCLVVSFGVAAFMPSPDVEDESSVVMVTRVLEPGETIRTIAKDEYPNQSRYKHIGHWVAVVIKLNGGHENFKPGDRVLLPMNVKK